MERVVVIGRKEIKISTIRGNVMLAYQFMELAYFSDRRVMENRKYICCVPNCYRP